MQHIPSGHYTDRPAYYEDMGSYIPLALRQTDFGRYHGLFLSGLPGAAAAPAEKPSEQIADT